MMVTASTHTHSGLLTWICSIYKTAVVCNKWAIRYLFLLPFTFTFLLLFITIYYAFKFSSCVLQLGCPFNFENRWIFVLLCAAGATGNVRVSCCTIWERSTRFWLVINTKPLNNPAPFCFRFAANVEPSEWADHADAGNKGIIISFSGNTVLLRETHIAAADQLVMNGLSCLAAAFLNDWSREQFNAH